MNSEHSGNVTNDTVVIPAFNEAHTVESTLKSFLEHPEVSKVVLIDNNSDDETFELAQRMIQSNPKLTVLKELKIGKSLAIRKALRSINADYYVMMASLIQIKSRA